jgi:vancomycin resistance protein YoaR
MYADLDIVDRLNHLYRSTYTEIGFDATVSYPEPDYKFKNNTNFPVKIKAWISDVSKINVAIIGTKEIKNKKVKIYSEIIKTYEPEDRIIYNQKVKSKVKICSGKKVI